MKGFFAYGSEHPHCGEFIESAINEINSVDPNIELKSWKNMNVSGNFIISEIINEIISSDFICADLTGLNENVLFEVGFAIGKGKNIWLIQDTSIIASYNRYKELNLLTTVGYQGYTSTNDIVDSFVQKKEYLKKNTILENIHLTKEETPTKNALLYLKSQFDTNYNQYIINSIEEFKLPVIIDDAVEVKVQPFTWYIEQLLGVPAVIVEFSSIYRKGYELQNAKCALIAGIALGLGMNMQMIAEKPHPTSIDYQEYLKKFSNIDLCKAAVTPFLTEVQLNIAQLFLKKKEYKYSNSSQSKLHLIKFGEFIAEHEANNISDYYIDRTHEENLIKSEYNIVVGRKGCGKTATLYYLESSINRDVRNEVILIKPVNFEIDGLIQLLYVLKSDFEKGYIIQSIWKFLIYTEIAKVIYENIKKKPLYAIYDNDKEIIEFVEKNRNVILSDFSTRLEQELINLNLIKGIDEQTEFRSKLSEILHENIIKELRELIVTYMQKKKKLVILIDNLDKNWKKGSDIEMVSKFILGLLGVIGRISKELKGNPKKPNEFDLSLIVFLRSDIFKHILTFSREPDKIEFYNLKWSDPEVLIRVLNKRIDCLSPDSTSELFWEKFICNTIDGIEVKNFILNCILPRPRDLIYFMNGAKSIAVARGHDYIQENDIKSAYHDYSNWIFKSLLVENGVSIDQIHSFLYNVMGEESIISEETISKLMKESNINIENGNIKKFIDHLCSLSFLGRETKILNFEFDYDFDSNEKNIALSQKLNSNRYKIHNAFIPYLECKDYLL